MTLFLYLIKYFCFEIDEFFIFTFQIIIPKEGDIDNMSYQIGQNGYLIIRVPHIHIHGNCCLFLHAGPLGAK